MSTSMGRRRGVRGATRCLGLLVAVIALAAAPAPAADNGGRTIARRTDAQLLELTGTLEDRLAEYPHLRLEPAIMLYRSTVVEAGSATHLILRSDLILVRDPKAPAATVREFTVNASSDLKYIAAWIRRGGKIIRLDKGAWNIVPGNEKKDTSIIFAFPDVQPGDILGWSTEHENDWTYGGGFLRMADKLPVMTCTARIRTDGAISYKIYGEHLRHDKWSTKVAETSHQVPSDVSLTAVDLPRQPQGRYAPEFIEFEAYVFAMFRGVWSDDSNTWFFSPSWNQVAIDASTFLAGIDDKCGSLDSNARAITANLATDRDRAVALNNYIRDDIVLMDPFMVRSRGRDLVSIYESRQATSTEKGILMYAMCRALGLDVDLVGGRSVLLSPLDMENPDMGQLGDLVVRLNGESPAWFSPQHRHCEPGTLPTDLRATKALEFTRGLKGRDRELMKEAWSNVPNPQYAWWNEYCRLLRALDLCRWVTLPGNPDAVMAAAEEDVRYGADDGRMQVTLRQAGFSDLQFDLHGHGTPAELLGDYLKGRFADATVDSAVFTAAPVRGAEATLSGWSTSMPVPGAMGDSWLVPGELVFGQAFLHDWDQAAGDPFIGRIVEDFRHTCHIPLPAGWTDCSAPQPVAVKHPQFTYTCRFGVADGQLEVRREIRIHRGMTMFDAVPAMVAAVARVQAFERQPVMLERRTAAAADGTSVQGR